MNLKKVSKEIPKSSVRVTYLSIILFWCLGIITEALSQNSGFDPEEYVEVMKISAMTTSDSSYIKKNPKPSAHKLLYQSPEIGLKNLWQLWLSEGNESAVISIRGTIADPVSWLENFYAGMVPAAGQIKLERDFEFEYVLAEDPKAAIHIGWLIGTAYLSRDILPRIDSLHQSGTKSFFIVGHSQGGGIAYLLHAYLHYLQESKKLPQDISFKTYCSAAPKPGNLHFAYDFENHARGKAFNIVNAADWVPQVPFSIQTIDDFSEINPFRNAKKTIKNQKFPERLVMKRVFNQLDKPTRKAQRNFEKYLGEKATRFIQKSLPEFEKPTFVSSNHYVRTGETIVLIPDSEYLTRFPDNPEEVFMHHFHRPYLELFVRKFDIYPELPDEYERLSNTK